MEALLEKEGKVENWNDDRLDEFSQTMKEGFAQVDRRFERVEGDMKEGFAKVDREMKEGFAQVDRRFERVEGDMKEGFAGVNNRIDKLFYLQILFLISLSIAVISHVVSV